MFKPDSLSTQGMNPMKRDSKSDLKQIGIVISLCILLSFFFYYRFFYIPKKILHDTLAVFETSIRDQDLEALRTIVSPEAPVYTLLGSAELLATFEKYQPGVEVVNAKYMQGSNNSIIYGIAQMKSRESGEYSELPGLYIQREKGVWRIKQFQTTNASINNQ